MATLKSRSTAESVLVYRLYEQDVLDDREDVLARALAGHRPGEPWFEPLPGGCFRWEDEAAARRRDRGGLPGTAAAARDAAAAFMRATNEAAAHYGPGQQGLRPFAIDTLRPLQVQPVRSRAGGGIDHWLTRWTMFLPPTTGSERDRAPVLGATVDVRVGANGNVFGVVSRTRPWCSVAARPALASAAEEHPNVPADEHATPDELVYLCDNPEEPQRFLAPCWLIEPEDEESHHARRLWPASDHTILPEIAIEERNGEAAAWAQVLGPRRRVAVVEHGHEWSVRWSIASLGDYLDGTRQVVTATTAPLPGAGVFQVELEVEHLPTGALRTSHRQVSIGAPQ